VTKSVTENMGAGDVLGQDHLDAIIADAEEVLIIALILLFFIEFDRFSGRLCH